MESSNFVDTVKSEKANAIQRYKHFTKILKLLQLMEILVAVALISWSSTRLPLVLKFSGEYLFAFTSYLMNQHVVFLVGNAIVLVCYVLSRYTDSGSPNHDGYDDHFTHRKTPNLEPVRIPVQVPVPSLETEPNEDRMKTDDEAIKEIIKTEVSDSETTTPEAALTAIKQAAKQIERFQRTQSDLKSKMSVKARRELRRSQTEMNGTPSSPVSFLAVDELSNEEFRVAVETFILRQQMFLKQQMMVEVER